MTDYRPIDCSDYDVLEIACMDKNDVAIETPDGVLEGRAVTLRIENSEEFLELLQRPSGDTRLVRVDRIRRITATSTPRRFESHAFAPSTTGN